MAETAPLDTLALVGDGDEIDLVRDIEAAFDIRFTPDEVRDWRTLGDVHATLANRLAPESRDGRCPTAMAFFRLRRALGETAGTRRVSPSTPLESLAEERPRKFLRELGRRSGLALPTPRVRRRGTIGGALAFPGAILALVAIGVGQWVAAAILLGIVIIGSALIAADPGSLPVGVATLGDLAHRAASLNRRQLRDLGARTLPGETWAVITAIAAEHAFVDPALMAPNTLLIEPRRRRA